MVDETEANKADLTNVTDKANYVDKAGAVKAKASVTNEAEARVADEAKIDEADEANLTNDADGIDEVGVADDPIMINKVVLGMLTLFVPFSLTKYSAIFAEVKGFFGINNNQLGSLKGGCLSPCSLMI